MAWRQKFGAKNHHESTPEFDEAMTEYPRTVYNMIAAHAAASPPLTHDQLQARFAICYQAQADLKALIDAAQQDCLTGDGATRPTQWITPISGQGDMGELRHPDDGPDNLLLHHRAYFAAPSSAPGMLLWLFAAPKPDIQLSSDWKSIQDDAIAKAKAARDAHCLYTGGCG